MKLVSIPDKYMFDRNSKGKHNYLIFQDKGVVKAVQTTHLYKYDDGKETDLKKKRLFKHKFNSFELPSGIKNSYFATNINGKKINPRASYIKPYKNEGKFSSAFRKNVARFATRKEQ